MGGITKIFGGGGAAPAAAPQEKPDPRRDINQAAQDASTAAQRASARRKRVSNQVQVGKVGARAGIKTALSDKPTRSGLTIS